MANNLPTSRMFSTGFAELAPTLDTRFDDTDVFKVCPITNSFSAASLDMATDNAIEAGALTEANGVEFTNEQTLTSVTFPTDGTTGVWSMQSTDTDVTFTSLDDTYVGILVYNDTTSEPISIINFAAERVVNPSLKYTPDATYGWASITP